MDWVTIAEGTTENLESTISNKIDLPPGTPVRMEFSVPWGMAYLANLSGAEQALAFTIPNELRVIDVHADGSSLIVAECEAIGVPILAILAIGVAVAIALGVVVLSIRVKAPSDVIDSLIRESRNVALILGVVAITGFLVYKYATR